MGWGAEWKKGYDRKEEREGKVMIMTNYYCDAQQRSEGRVEAATGEVHSTYTPTYLSLCLWKLFFWSIHLLGSNRPAGLASRRRSSCAILLYIMCFFCNTVPTCQGRPQFATTPKNNDILLNNGQSQLSQMGFLKFQWNLKKSIDFSLLGYMEL